MSRLEREYPDNNNKLPGSSTCCSKEDEKPAPEVCHQGSGGGDDAKMTIVWVNVLIMIYLHVGGLIGYYYWFTLQCYWQTVLLGFFFGYVGAFGVTCGAHRLFAHRSYKAKLPLRILLAYMQTVACQNSLHEWCRDHRVHHKFSETHADPHNAKNGFFFAHIGWLLVKKHEDVKIKGKTVDMSDLEADPVVMFQKTYFIPLTIIFSFVIPTMIPWYFWGEDGYKSWCMTLGRYIFTLNATWLVNSAAHIWGNHPYDKGISPAENKLVSILTPGEGWHNYHHVFPWDYKAAELGTYKYNLSTGVIDFFAWIGLAYDLKSVPEKIVMQRVNRTGDGSHEFNHQNNHNNKHNHETSSDLISDEICNKLSNEKTIVEADSNRNYIYESLPPNPWGWDDKDIPKKDKDVTVIHYRKLP